MKLNLPKLYKMTSTGAIQEWSIDVANDGVPHYLVTYGQKDGKMQVNRVDVPTGKNIGKSNETTAEEQCLSEAESKWTKQRDRKGYTEEIPKSKPFRPMLAQPYEKAKDKIDRRGYFVQPKLDGIRCFARIDNMGDVTLLSRTNKRFFGLEHIAADLASYVGKTLDGELYSDKLDFQKITSLVRKEKNVSDQSLLIQYRIYDYVSDDDFKDRYSWLNNNLVHTPNVRTVPTFQVKNDEYVQYLEKFLTMGYEGLMIRNTKGSYQVNRRSPNLIKVKKFIDEEYEIVGWKTGKGKHKDVPTFRMRTKDGKEFEATPEGSMEYRKELLDDAVNIVGKMGTVRFFEYTNDGIPRFPVFVVVRDYE